eukprot:132402_1
MANHIININKWDKQKQSPIGKNIMLRFGSQGFSLGISYSQKGNQIREFGLNADELLNRIGNVFSVHDQRCFIQTFEHTFSLEYIQSNFKFWKDVANDPNWQNTVDLYLKNLKCDILKPLYQPQMPSLVNVSVETVNCLADHQAMIIFKACAATSYMQMSDEDDVYDEMYGCYQLNTKG